MAWLTFEVESRDGSYRERIRFAGRALTIGRDAGCDIVVGHSTVSAVHARIIRSRRRLRLEDAESRNGVLLNRIPVGTASVHAGDVLTLGRNGPEVHLIEFDAGPAVLPRLLLTLLILLGTTGGVYALRQEQVEDWLGRARLWLPQYEGARWFAADVPANPPAPPPEEPVDPRHPEGGPTGREAPPGTEIPPIREIPVPPTNFGNHPIPPGTIPKPPVIDHDTPLANQSTTLPGPTAGSAREALARSNLVPPNLTGPVAGLSERFLFAGVKSGVDTGAVNQTLGRAKAKLRATFPEQNLLLLEVQKSSLTLDILRDSGLFGILNPATEGAPGGVDAKTQAAALQALISSLDPLPAWADRSPAAGPTGTAIPRFPPGTRIASLDVRSARMAAVGERVLVVYELVTVHGPEGHEAKSEESRALILTRQDGALRATRDLPVETLPADLKTAIGPLLSPPRQEDR